jgi:cytochrome c
MGAPVVENVKKTALIIAQPSPTQRPKPYTHSHQEVTAQQAWPRYTLLKHLISCLQPSNPTDICTSRAFMSVSADRVSMQPIALFYQPGTDMKKIVFALALTAAAAAPAFADQALATAKNCMACHAVDKKIVGPAYKEVAAKYKGDKAAVDKLATKILKGGSGVWGAIPMPANPQVSDAEAKKLAAWVLSAK